MSAYADIAVGLGTDPIVLGQPANPGQTYSMSPVYVVNSGSDPARYQLSVQRLSPGDEITVPAEWLTLGDNSFVLSPNESKYVTVTLKVPANAALGSYLTNILATAGPPGPAAGGGIVGSGAADRVLFDVAAAASSPAATAAARTAPAPGSTGGGIPSWLFVAGGVVVILVVLAILIARAFGVGVTVERK